MQIKKGILFLISIVVFGHYSLAGSNLASFASWAAPADVKKMIVAGGYLWIAGGGLTQYDITLGKSKKFLVQQGLAANAVFDVAVDIEGHRAWAATTSGLNCLNLKTGRWKNFGTPEGLGDLFILSLCIYPRGPHQKTVLFIGSRTGGLYMLPGDDAPIIAVPDKKALPDRRVSCIAADPGRHSLWIGTPAGVICCAVNTDALPRIEPGKVNHDLSARRLVVNERTGNVFCLTDYNEIFQYKLEEKKWEKIPAPGEDIHIKDLILDDSVGGGAYVAYAAADQGIFAYHPAEKKWLKLPGNNGEAVLGAAVDSRNHILFFAAREGIYAMPPGEKDKKARLLIANSPPFNNTINAIFIDEKTGTAWLGVDGGIVRFEKKKQQWRFFPLSPFPGERVLALFVDHKDIWFGTVHYGPWKMDRITGRIKSIPGIPGNVANAMVTSIIGDLTQKKVWFGLHGTRGGVYEYDLQARKIRVLPFLDAVSVTYLLEEGDWIWAATARGAAKYNKSIASSRTAGDPFEPQLAFGGILTLAIDSKQNCLWLTTEYNVIMYDRTRRMHKIFSSAGGFPRSPITSSLFAGGKIWLGAEGFGLHRVDSQDSRAETKNRLTRVAGLADRYIISLAYDKKEENLWVGTVYGGLSLVHFKE